MHAFAHLVGRPCKISGPSCLNEDCFLPLHLSPLDLIVQLCSLLVKLCEAFPKSPSTTRTLPTATSAILQNDSSELLSLCWSQCPWHHGCVIVAQDCTADRLIFGARWSDTPVGIFPENNHCLPEDCGYFVCFLWPEVNTGPLCPL